MRRDPIYLSTFTGRPPDEPSILGEALTRFSFRCCCSSNFRRSSISGLPPEGAPTGSPSFSIRKAYAGHASRVMMGVWSYLRQFIYTKFVIVVDDDIDARDWKDVMWRFSTRMDPVRDVTWSSGRRSTISTLPRPNLVSAADRFDATNKLPRDAPGVGPPDPHDQRGCLPRSPAKGELRAAGSGKPIWK